MKQGRKEGRREKERRSVPYPVSRGRRDVDGQSARELQDLDAEHQRHVGHLGNLLPDVLVLCGFLEILGLCYLVHEPQDLPACAATGVPEGEERQR